jgi:hypothetical protein
MLTNARWPLLVTKPKNKPPPAPPTIGPALLSEFDGEQLKLLARLTRARPKNQSGGVFPPLPV